ncbi:MAG: [Fe-Fe] hydrogenase large subunit C-terminal domain-containing protein [Planctomycetota bacterium]|nr:[Fe-Fe] hydrogenase large subunit C-terminal domain-containing protein [Planctomycetota bacterium]
MPVISTIPGKCRRCYNCVRSCPAHAVRVKAGQAEVIEERCVACGTCVRVCAQKAKQVESHVDRVKLLLAGNRPVVACLAPSFPAAFDDIRPLQFVSALKQLGFNKVVEVAFGAQLVAAAYEKIIAANHKKTLITTPCPAIVGLIEKHYSSLVPFLAPVVSPMIAMGRVVKQKYMPDALVVFIGPCTAKKLEMNDEGVAGTVDAVLTFDAVSAMFAEKGIDPRLLGDTPTDGPRPGIARAFPITGGLLASAGLRSDAVTTDTIVTEGRERVLETLADKAAGKTRGKFLDILFCEGCINGPLMDTKAATDARKEAVIDFLKENVDEAKAARDIEEYGTIDMSRAFSPAPAAASPPTEEQIRVVLASVKKTKPEDELNCGACGYTTCRQKAIAVIQGLAEAEMCLPYLIEELQDTHQALLQMERLSSVGQMAAGVAHEINNPLTGIIVYIRLLQKALNEKRLKEDDLKNKLGTMETEIARCSKIIRGLLDFARPSEPTLRRINVQDVVGSATNVLGPEMQMAGVKIDSVAVKGVPDILADPDQLLQVFTNLGLNAIQAMPGGGMLQLGTGYDPEKRMVSIWVKDTGTGIAPEDIKKLFTPFFTTKSKGKGAGLGLAVSYGIIKRHGGQILVESKVGEGTKFTIALPVSPPGAEPRA